MTAVGRAPAIAQTVLGSLGGRPCTWRHPWSARTWRLHSRTHCAALIRSLLPRCSWQIFQAEKEPMTIVGGDALIHFLKGG